MNVTSNTPKSILDKTKLKLHTQPGPLNIVWRRIQVILSDFVPADNFPEQVSTVDCFDKLRIPADHPARRPSDTYYLTPAVCLRTHTTVHEIEMLQRGHDKFLVCGDVYRKDSIDQYHYPVFHQVEGVKVFPLGTPLENIIIDLKKTLEYVIMSLFPGVTKFRWRNYYRFPFTCPSFELDMMHTGQSDSGQWVEILGCGILHPEVIAHTGREVEAWAFGIGLERVAMILFGIPDIRLFWTNDQRFHSQFMSVDPLNPKSPIKFEPYSNYPVCYKDISMWITGDLKAFKREFHSLVRELGGDLVESIETTDRYHDQKNNRHSRCFRIMYRSPDRTLTNEEINDIQAKIIATVPQKLNVTVR